MRNNEKVAGVLIKVIMIIMALVIVGVLSLSAQTGYLVVIEKGNETTIRKSRTQEQLKKVVDLYFPESDINITELMKGSVFFEVRRYDFRFYVEMKKVNKNGKLRRLGRKEIRKIESKLK